MNLIRKARSALAHGFRPSQLTNRGLFELGTWLRVERCFHRPIWLHLFVSSRCNFRCRFCTNHASEGMGRVEMAFHPPTADMTLATFEDVLGRYDRAMVCTFCGVGEPFLNRDLLAMVRLAASRRMITEVVTNGSLLDTRTIRGVLDSGLHRLTVSLLEANAASHRDTTGISQPVFQRIVEALRILRAARDDQGRATPSIRISRVLTQSTRRLGYDFIELGLELGVDDVLLNNLIFADVGTFTKDECLWDTPENRTFFEEMRAKYYGHRTSVIVPVLLKLQGHRSCDWYWRNISVDAVGNVTGCGRFIVPKPAFGSVFGPDPWNGAHFRKMRRRFREHDLVECCCDCVETSI